MNYEEFKSYIIEHIIECLPDEYQDADLFYKKIIKNNDTVLEGLQIAKKDDNMIPVLYINGLYKEYQEGKEIDDVVSELADIYMESSFIEEEFSPDMPFEEIGEYDRIKDKIICRLVNRESNKKLLQDKPFTPVEDLALTYHIQIKGDESGIGSIAITNTMMNTYGVDVAELHEQAMANMERLSPPVIKPLREILMDLMLPDFMEEHAIGEAEARKNLEMVMQGSNSEGTSEIICVSNACGINGAACIVSPEVQQKVAEKIGGDYYALPASVHEILAIAKTENFNYVALQDMVQCTNRSKVSEDEVLSDSVYEYNAKERVFHIVDSVKQIDLSETIQEKEIKKHGAKLH